MAILQGTMSQAQADGQNHEDVNDIHGPQQGVLEYPPHQYINRHQHRHGNNAGCCYNIQSPAQRTDDSGICLHLYPPQLLFKLLIILLSQFFYRIQDLLSIQTQFIHTLDEILLYRFRSFYPLGGFFRSQGDDFHSIGFNIAI